MSVQRFNKKKFMKKVNLFSSECYQVNAEKVFSPLRLSCFAAALTSDATLSKSRMGRENLEVDPWSGGPTNDTTRKDGLYSPDGDG